MPWTIIIRWCVRRTQMLMIEKAYSTRQNFYLVMLLRNKVFFHTKKRLNRVAEVIKTKSNEHDNCSSDRDKCALLAYFCFNSLFHMSRPWVNATNLILSLYYLHCKNLHFVYNSVFICHDFSSLKTLYSIHELF